MSLSIVLCQVGAMLGSLYGRATNSLDVIHSGTELKSNFVWAFLISSEFSIFPRTSYGLHVLENEVTHMNKL